MTPVKIIASINSLEGSRAVKFAQGKAMLSKALRKEIFVMDLNGIDRTRHVFPIFSLYLDCNKSWNSQVSHEQIKNNRKCCVIQYKTKSQLHTP